VEAVGRASAFAKSYLQEAHPVSFSKNLLTIGFDIEFEDHMALFDVPRNHTLLQTKLAELGHPNSQLKFVKAEPPAGWKRPKAEPAAATTSTPPVPAKAASAPAPAASPSPAPPVKERTAPVAFSKDDFKNDPLIQKALEIFKGQIVEVRA
jgi:DNA polymerase-3 subunit gamma/tau